MQDHCRGPLLSHANTLSPPVFDKDSGKGGQFDRDKLLCAMCCPMLVVLRRYYVRALREEAQHVGMQLW